MNAIRLTPRFRGVAFCGLGALLFAGTALAETPQQTYQRERAACDLPPLDPAQLARTRRMYLVGGPSDA